MKKLKTLRSLRIFALLASSALLISSAKGQPLLPNTIKVGVPNGEDSLFFETTYTIRWQALITRGGNFKVELLKGNFVYSLLAANIAIVPNVPNVVGKPNDQKFEWSIPKSLPAGNDYSIRVSSLSTPSVRDDSDTKFSIGPDKFPVNNVLPIGWVEGGPTINGKKITDKIWEVTKSSAFSGAYSLTSGKLGDGKTASIAYSSNFKAGTVSFVAKVSSELNYDYFNFYIDGVAQVLNPLSPKGISGDVDWPKELGTGSFSFPVTAGDHTFRWAYKKEDSFGELRDAAWIDSVVLPETTQEIAVTNPSGVNIQQGASSVDFSGVDVGFPSTAQVFTIKNEGSANLTGLLANTSGKNGADFKATLGKTLLVPGESTTCSVVFTPQASGSRVGTLEILSNDADEGNFKVSLLGLGLPTPKITVSGPTGLVLVDAAKKPVNLGPVIIKKPGVSYTFRIKNDGQKDLKDLALTLGKKGTPRDFNFTNLSVTTLAPGASTTFDVIFKPTALGRRSVTVAIASNDRATSVFDFKIVGTGVTKLRKPGKGKALDKRIPSFGQAAGGNPGISCEAIIYTTSTELVDGKTYLSLTVDQSLFGGIVGTVEVSSDLLNWQSGVEHTTVLIDDSKTYKVRDNTPLTVDEKRFIRFR